MDTLINCFDFRKHEIISLIGSGGKTTLMWYLANSFRKEKVLVTTSTKIGFPPNHSYDFYYCEQFDKLGTDGCGITVAGIQTADHRKFSMPSTPSFQASFRRFDKVLIEADGSKQLPLKGWETFEPVILEETTTTIGVIPITVIGEKIGPKTVHRLPLFLRATDTTLGEPITAETLAEIIASPLGMWVKSAGARIVCITQVETAHQIQQAKTIVAHLPQMLLTRLAKVIACNSQTGEGIILWEK